MASCDAERASVCSLDVHLSDHLRIKSSKDEIALAQAHGLALWLQTFYFPSQIRKATGPVTVTCISRGCLQVKGTFDKQAWDKRIRSGMKKVVAEDLGRMDAVELLESIPETDSEGRGIDELRATEKKLSVKVVFDDITGHVLLVGDAKKLEKKCFALRNMLSHFHWRLSGTDVAFGGATSKR